MHSPNLLEVLNEYPSIEVNTGILLAHLPVLQSRFYSISSSRDLYPKQLHITVAVVTYHTNSKSYSHELMATQFMDSHGKSYERMWSRSTVNMYNVMHVLGLAPYISPLMDLFGYLKYGIIFAYCKQFRV